MKQCSVVLIFLFSFKVMAQDIERWQVGINLNPFIFTQLSPDFYPEKKGNKYPNGFGYGLTIEKNWNEHWGIKTGFESIKHKEKYYVDDTSADEVHLEHNLEYYRLPIMLQYSISLSEKLFLTFNQGFQFSFFKDMKLIEEGNQQRIVFTSDYYEYVFFDHPEQNYSGHGKQKLFKETLFGLVGSVGIKGFLSDKLSYSTNLRYEYDITDADNSTFFKNSYNPKPTRFFRIGLEFGIQYHFSINDRFDKRPHKL